MRCHHDETDVLQEVRADDAVVDRAVARASSTGRTSGSPRVDPAARRPPRVRPKASSARTPRRTNSSITRAMRLCGRSSEACPSSTPIDVSSTASAETGAVGNRCARGTAPGGA